MPRLSSRTAKAAVSAGLALTIVLGSVPTGALADAIAESHSARALPLVLDSQASDDADVAASVDEESASDESGTGAGDAAAGDAEADGVAATDASDAAAADDAETGDAAATDAATDEGATTGEATAPDAETTAATTEAAAAAEDEAAAPAAAGDVAQVGSTTYPTLSAAVAALNDGDTLTLLADVQEDVTIDNSNVTITSTSKDKVAYKGYMQVTASNVTIKNVKFDMQTRVMTETNLINFNIGLRIRDAANVTVEDNTFNLPATLPQADTRGLEVNAIYAMRNSGNLKIKGNTFNITEHGGYSVTYRALALRGRDTNDRSDATLDGVNIDGNTVNMTGTYNSPDNSSSGVFVDAKGGLTGNNYGIKNVTINNNTVNGGATANNGTNKTFGFLAVGVDGLTFTNNTADNLEYAIIFGNEAGKNGKINNIQVGGNNLATSTWDIWVPSNANPETRLGPDGVKLTQHEKGKAKNSWFNAGLKLDGQQYYQLCTNLGNALAKVPDNQKAEVIVLKDPNASVAPAAAALDVAANKDVTLDLNGYELTGQAGNVDGTLTIKDGSAANTGRLTTPLAARNGGSITVESGTVTGSLNAQTGSTVAVAGGTVSGKITAQAGANATVSGGSVGDVTAERGSTVKVTNGTVTGTVASNGATVTISGGDFTGAAPTGEEGEVTITGGTFAQKPNVLHAENKKGFKLENDNKYHVANAELTFTGAIATGTYDLDVKSATALDANTLKGWAEVSVPDYTIDVDDSVLTKINEAIAKKEIVDSPFTLTFTAKKVGTNKVESEAQVTKDLTVNLTDTRAMHTVTFNMNGANGTAPANQNVKDGDKLQSVTVPTREGYTFDGWYDNANGTGTAIDFTSYTVTGDLTLYAKWTPKTYTYTFDAKGGNTVGPLQVTYGEVPTLPTPTNPKPGYVFYKWYTDASGTQEYDTTKTVTGDLKLYAKWALVVSFNENGGDANSLPTAQNIPWGEKASNPTTTTPTREGYTFQGWYKDAAGNVAYDWNEQVKTPTTLYAKWQVKTFTVSYDANANGDNVTGMPANQANVEWNTNATEPDITNPPTRTGYTFTGWYTDAGAKNKFDFATTPIKGDTTLYAGWRANTYTVTLNQNSEGDIVGNMPANPTASYGTAATEPDTASPPTRIGYTFVGWYTDAQGNQAYDWTTPVTQDVTLYAKWQAVKHKVTFDVAGGNETYPQQDVAYGDLVTDPGTPTRDGYTFVGWFYENTQWEFDKIGMPNEELTLTAKWTAKTYEATYKFNYDGAPADQLQDITHDQRIAPIADPTRTGYRFDGWYTDAAGTQRYDFNTLVSGPVTLYAKWNASDNKVTFDSAGGSNVAGFTVKTDGLVTRPADPEWYGHTFLGWFTADGSEWNFDTDKMPAGDLKLTAHWEVQDRTVSFVTNGGSEVASQTVKFGQAVARPADPAREGFTFAGWFSDEALTQAYNFDAPVTGDVALYAKWEAVVVDGGQGGQDVQGDEAADGKLPQTGDITSLAAPGVLGAIGSAFIGVAAALRRRNRK